MGSYHRTGTTAKAVDEVLAAARQRGAQTSLISLLDKRIEFCRNCRECTQAAGEKRGKCPQSDDMESIMNEIDAADGFVFGAPVNFYNINALSRRFMERLAPYAYWPWGKSGPKMRLEREQKKAVLITSSAMPSLIGRVFTSAIRALKNMAFAVGAPSVKTLFIGLAAQKPNGELSNGDKKIAAKLGRWLVK
jgi:multimeric flavodoxin WrbA